MPMLSLRLPDDDYEALQAVSLITGRSVSELVREAVASSLRDFAASGEMERRYEEAIRDRKQALDKFLRRRDGQ